jgi:preprotein translocase subunit SecG
LEDYFKMSGLTLATVIFQIILSLILIVVVLFQHGTQSGLSGSIAGGAETFFGKNKGRTIDAQLKKWTAVVAILFLVTSIALSLLVQNTPKTTTPATDATQTPVTEQAPATEQTPAK